MRAKIIWQNLTCKIVDWFASHIFGIREESKTWLPGIDQKIVLWKFKSKFDHKTETKNARQNNLTKLDLQN